MRNWSYRIYFYKPDLIDRVLQKKIYQRFIVNLKKLLFQHASNAVQIFYQLQVLYLHLATLQNLIKVQHMYLMWKQMIILMLVWLNQIIFF